jgi:hypothetical protein
MASDKDAPSVVAPRASGTLKEIPSPNLLVTYSNYTSVAAVPDECILRFCRRNLDGQDDATEIVRIYLPIAHAKRLILAMTRTVKSYEELFGEVSVEPKLTPEGRRVMALAEQAKIDAND